MPTLIIPSPLIFYHPYSIIKWTVATWSILIGQGFEPCVFEGYSVTVLVYTTQMAAKQKHRIAGNPYNLRKKVEIPVQIQLEDDSAFLKEFASQPIPGQVLGSKTGSDTDNTST